MCCQDSKLYTIETQVLTDFGMQRRRSCRTFDDTPFENPFRHATHWFGDRPSIDADVRTKYAMTKTLTAEQ